MNTVKQYCDSIYPRVIHSPRSSSLTGLYECLVGRQGAIITLKWQCEGARQRSLQRQKPGSATAYCTGYFWQNGVSVFWRICYVGRFLTTYCYASCTDPCRIKLKYRLWEKKLILILYFFLKPCVEPVTSRPHYLTAVGSSVFPILWVLSQAWTYYITNLIRAIQFLTP